MDISKTWSDILCDQIIEQWLEGVREYRRLVKTGLYTEQEYKELARFTSWLRRDYEGRFQWCKQHNVIERRGRSIWSRWWHDSPLDEIITVYGVHDINVKGYKDKKHVLELHFNNLNSFADFERELLDKYRLMVKNPDFLGRRDTTRGINWIGDGSGLFGDVDKWILEDEPIELLKSNIKAYEITGNAPGK